MMQRAEFWYKHFEKVKKKLQEMLMTLITIMNGVQLSINLKQNLHPKETNPGKVDILSEWLKKTT